MKEPFIPGKNGEINSCFASITEEETVEAPGKKNPFLEKDDIYIEKVREEKKDFRPPKGG